MKNQCRKCGELYTLRPDCEPTAFCGLCAQGALPGLLDLAQQVEWMATGGEDRGGVPYQPTEGDWLRLWHQARAALSKAGVRHGRWDDSRI